jgi:8-oxo-dGTP diphosphatase
MADLFPFNVRVYGILLNEERVLITDEYRYGMYITKFPGGGLQFGEGTVECLKREFMEEMEMEIEIIDHYYTTDFFQVSAFDSHHQLMSIYYLVKPVTPMKRQLTAKKFDLEPVEEAQSFRMLILDDDLKDELTFPIDQKVAEMLVKQFRNSMN